MAKVISLGSVPVNEGEALAIHTLEANLPANFTIYPNREIPQTNRASLECDAIVVAPHAVFVVEIKDWHGTIIGNDNIWRLGTNERTSPVKGVNHKARVLKGWLDQSGPIYKNVWVEGLIVINDKQTVLNLTGASQRQTFYLDKVATYLQSPARLLAPHPVAPNAIASLVDGIKETISGMPAVTGLPKKFGHYRVREALSVEEDYAEYLAENSLVKGLPPVRLRVFEYSPYTPKPERQRRFHKIKNEFSLLQTVGSHPNILPAQNLFEQDGDKLIEVTEWNGHGTTLEALILEEIPLTIERKLEIMRGLLAGIEAVHTKGVIHRAITPAGILVGENYIPRLMNFDRARLDTPAAVQPTTVWAKPTQKEDIPYLAPELNQVDYHAYPASDLYSLGIIFFQLLTNNLPVNSPQEALKIDPSELKVSEFVEGLPGGIDEFITKLWQPDLSLRYSQASQARQDFERILHPEPLTPTNNDTTPISSEDLAKYNEYKSGDLIDNQYLVQKVLGRGGSSVVYEVYSPLLDQIFAMKVINQGVDVSFLQQEFHTLKNLNHPNIARAEWAAQIYQAQYYLLTEFVEGEVLTDYINGKLKMNVQEAIEIARNILDAMEYLHTPGSNRLAILHRDIKPSNIVRTRDSLKIIDFNIAAPSKTASQTLIGTPGYIAPDLSQNGWDASCDLYAAGVVLYQLVTQHHPYEDMSQLTAQSVPHDPRKFVPDLHLSQTFTDFLIKACTPLRQERFSSAAQMRQAMVQAKPFIVKPVVTEIDGRAKRVKVEVEEWQRPDYNPYVTRFLTLYSQARRNNKGTRGLDDIAEATYVKTRLDEKLLPAILEGRHPLVVITGNAGDGKTAFIQNLEKAVREEGFEVTLLKHGNGTRFKYRNLEFITNYDGSQDEGENVNDAVLKEFFEPFAGVQYHPAQGQVRLIAINEGRLRDFFENNWQQFPWLKKVVFEFFDEAGDKKLPEDLLIVNLNLRSVVAGKERSIFSRQLEAFGDDSFWSPCESCSIKDRCFIKFNIDTFRDKINGPEITERLRTVFETVHLRRRLHVTMRDMRSALSYLIFRDHTCEDVAVALESTLTDPTEYLNKFYYNVLAGQDAREAQQVVLEGEASAGIEVRVDRLIDLLTQVDVALVSNPQIDREMHFDGKTGGPPLFDLYSRSHVDEIMLETLQNNLTFGFEIAQNNRLISDHRLFHYMERRKAFFERREVGWLKMLPYEQLGRFREVTQLEPTDPSRLAALKELKIQIISGISLSEGSKSKSYNKKFIWLRASQTDKPTIKSYRLFPANDFDLVVMNDLGALGEYLEYTPDNIILRHKAHRSRAELIISLDLMELLFQISEGFKPSLNDLRGAYINLTIFRNSLSHLSFRNLILTENNRDFYQLSADESNRLILTKEDAL